jgi:hypothetical protein
MFTRRSSHFDGKERAEHTILSLSYENAFNMTLLLFIFVVFSLVLNDG